MVRDPGEAFRRSSLIFANPNAPFVKPARLACVVVLLFSVVILAPLAAQDQSQVNASPSSCVESPAATYQSQPGQMARTPGDSVSDEPTAPSAPNSNGGANADPATATDSSSISSTDATRPDCPASATLQVSRYSSPDYFSSEALAEDTFPQNSAAAALTTPSKYPVTARTGKWGGEEWRPAILQTLGFSIAQNGYRLATEQKTRDALVKETWHSYWLAISGLHTWSDGGKTWTVYVAHPAQGAVFNDIWTEHDPHGALVPFGFNHAYWGSRIKAFWWDSVWELQWKFGPFSEASIGNVGLKPGKLGANTIVSSAFIGTGLAVAEDMADRYAVAKWERHTDNLFLRALLRSALNPDRSFANLFRKKYPWYRDARPTLRDLEP
jgi:hypothetical protein